MYKKETKSKKVNLQKKRFSYLNLVLISAFVVVFLSSIPLGFSQNLDSERCRLTQAQATHSITLYGAAFQGWGYTEQSLSSPGPQIEFQEGDLYNMTLVSVDGFTHNFYIDYNGNGNPDGDEPTSPDFTSTINYQFTPDRTGAFTYYCHYHHTVMYGNATIIPEFSSFALIAALIIVTALVLAYTTRIHPKKLEA